MTLIKTLSDKESEVLTTIKEIGSPIDEDSYHMLNEMMDYSVDCLGFKYKFVHWGHLDKNFRSKFGGVQYSQELHEIIDGLVDRGYLQRTTDNPIELNYVKQKSKSNLYKRLFFRQS